MAQSVKSRLGKDLDEGKRPGAGTGRSCPAQQAQTYHDFEIVVVDGGSTDDTAEVASRYQEVRLIRQENRGQAAGRNAGLSQSIGNFPLGAGDPR